MKYIVIKIYETDYNYFLKVEYIRFTEKKRIIDKELFKDFSNLEGIRYYLNNYTINSDYKNSHLFINYISNKIIIDNINITDIKKDNNKIREKVNELYPNFDAEYNNSIYQYSLSNRKKFVLLNLLPKNILNDFENSLTATNVKKKNISYLIDVPITNQYLDKIKTKLSYKHIIFIQAENGLWRFSEILHGVMVNFIFLYENDESFLRERNNIFKNIDRSIDEIIIDSDYKTYMSLNNDWKAFNVIHIDSSNQFRYFDEKKLLYASK